MNKQQALNKIAQEIADCAICKVDTIGVAVPGEGNPDANIVFMGEAPGKQEAKTGRPFIGRSGNLLRKNIQAIGLNENDIFITSPVKYLPKRGTPTTKDIEHGLIHTSKQLEIIQPKLVVLMGATAAFALLGEKVPVMAKHGTTIKNDDSTFYLTIHPAAAIRFNKFLVIFEQDFQKLHKLITEMKIS